MLHTSKGLEPDRRIEVRKRRDDGNRVKEGQDNGDAKTDYSNGKNETSQSSREGKPRPRDEYEKPVQCKLVETRCSEDAEEQSSDECGDDSGGEEEVVAASGNCIAVSIIFVSSKAQYHIIFVCPPLRTGFPHNVPFYICIRFSMSYSYCDPAPKSIGII